MTLGDRVYVVGYIDEIRKDVVIIRNDSGYFGTEEHNVFVAETVKEREAKSGLIRCKDCEFWENKNAYRDYPLCSYHCTEMDENDYCSKGRWKEQ